MSRELLSPVAILDATHGTARRAAAPWLGAYWICLLPLRLLQILFVRELFDLGFDVARHGGRLLDLAWMMNAALLPALAGRALWIRACHLSMEPGSAPGVEVLRLPPVQLGHLVYAALLSEVVFGITSWAVIFIPLLILAAGLGAASMVRSERPGLLRPLAEIGRLAINLRVTVPLLFTFGLALPFIYVNLYLAVRAVLWVLQSLGGADAARWAYLIRPIPFIEILPADPLTAALCGAGTLLAVEPFWLASLCVYVHRERLRESGEDLRLRFRREIATR